MKGKGGQAGFFKAVIVAGFILLANAGFFAYKYRGNFAGYAVSEGIVKTYSEISQLSRILFVAQWALIFLFLVFLFFRDRKIKSNDIGAIKSSRVLGKFSTDIDSLYSVLQEKKKLRLSTISKAFNIKEDTALEWCRILESGNLAVIDYPGVGEAVVKLP